MSICRLSRKLSLLFMAMGLMAFSFFSCEQPASNSSLTPTVSTVTVSPANATVEKGGTQNFSATVTGTNSPAQTVTWSIVQTNKKSGTTINSEGMLTVAADESLTTLTVKATSTADTTKSGTAAVTVNDPSLLTLNGEVSISPSGTVNINTPLTASYSGSETVSYQWEKDGTAISGATSASYTPASGGIYTVIVSLLGYNSKTSASVTVNDPSLLTLSGEVSISPSGSVTEGTLLTASYSGSEAVSYQWEKDGIAISGATNAIYTPTEAGIYTVIVSLSGYNEKTSESVTVNAPLLETLEGEVSISPSDNVTAGTTLTANYSGSENVSYQWEKDEIAINGATSQTYTPTTAGDYTVIVSAAGYNEKISGLVTVTVPTFADTISMAAYLATFDDNTAVKPYIIALNVDNPTSVGAVITYSNKYVSLDLSDSTFTSIGYDAFENCSRLVSIIIPDSVTSIGQWAFRNCSSLASITIPDSVTSIGGNAFSNCSSLTSITIPDSVTRIGGHAFSDCSSLTSVTIGNSASIEVEAFQNCTSLANVTIGNGVTSIGQSAFGNCSSLTSITIPDSVTSIDSYAFYGCSSLTSIVIPDGITSIAHETFDGCTSLTSITIPDSVTRIGWRAFENCSSLTSITIPDSVTSIEYFTFYNCSSLTSITIPESVTSIENFVFDGCTSLVSVTFNGTIAGASFSTAYPFPGDLRNRYLAVGGGVGTYTTTAPVIYSSVWTKVE